MRRLFSLPMFIPAISLTFAPLGLTGCAGGYADRNQAMSIINQADYECSLSADANSELPAALAKDICMYQAVPQKMKETNYRDADLYEEYYRERIRLGHKYLYNDMPYEEFSRLFDTLSENLTNKIAYRDNANARAAAALEAFGESMQQYNANVQRQQEINALSNPNVRVQTNCFTTYGRYGASTNCN